MRLSDWRVQTNVRISALFGQRSRLDPHIRLAAVGAPFLPRNAFEEDVVY